MSKTVLMCSGPADGRWVTVEDHVHAWEIAVPVWTGSLRPEDPLASGFTSHRYQIYREDLFGGTLWVGVPVDELYDGDRRVIMRAVLQRDVAQHLGAYR